MRFDSPVLHPDPRRDAFFDGMGEEHARLRFGCAACGADNDAHLLSFVDAAHVWFRGLDDADRQRIVRVFDCPLREFDGKAMVSAHTALSPYFGLRDCAACGCGHLLYVAFGELQPARYQATLQGIARLAVDDVPEAPLAPALSFALPFDSGRVLLSFADGQRRLTPVLFAGPTLRRFGSSALGIAWGSDGGLHVDALFAASTVAPEAPPPRLVLGRRNLAPSALHPEHHECGFVLRPFEPAPFVLYETIGGGIAGGGGEGAFGLAALRAIAGWRDELQAAGCDWAVAPLETAADDAAAIRALIAASTAREGPMRDLFPDDSLTHAPRDAAMAHVAAPATVAKVEPAIAPAPPIPASMPASESGWSAAPDEPPLYFVSEARLASPLAADIAIVAQRMLDERENDRASGADAILFVSDGTQFKLYAYWYDPVAGEAIGEWRYTLVLRHLLDDDDFDSEDLEGLCYFAVDHYLGHLAPQDLRVFYRNEFGTEFLEIERFEW
jgi:hypothetical protein